MNRSLRKKPVFPQCVSIEAATVLPLATGRRTTSVLPSWHERVPIIPVGRPWALTLGRSLNDTGGITLQSGYRQL